MKKVGTVFCCFRTEFSTGKNVLQTIIEEAVIFFLIAVSNVPIQAKAQDVPTEPMASCALICLGLPLHGREPLIIMNDIMYYRLSVREFYDILQTSRAEMCSSLTLNINCSEASAIVFFFLVNLLTFRSISVLIQRIQTCFVVDSRRLISLAIVLALMLLVL
jgi:hypothetical protein